MDKQNREEPDPISDERPSQYAPWFHVPELSVVSVEHPFIIENMESALAMLGGVSRIRSLIKDENRGALAALYFRPQDPMCKPMTSNNIATNDIVLKVTVCKRTGLKRRKGASGPYHEGLEDDGITRGLKDTRYMLRSLRDNPGNYNVQAIGSIHQTHRFRNLPDFVYSTISSPFMTRMKEIILPFEYEKLKNFKMDMSKGPRINMDLIPPPRWSHLTIPFNYSYLQNPAAKQTLDGRGNVILKNSQIHVPTKNQAVPYDVREIPSHPSADLPPVACLEPAMQRLIREAQRLFDERPIWTRRALRNRLPEADWKKVGDNHAKYLYQYIGYLWASGPWRDAVNKFGIDPRDDVRYRHYQTTMFVIGPQPGRDLNAATQSPSGSHLFDGKRVAPDGKLFQACDISDPLLVSVLSTTNLRDKCHIYGDGWFLNGTWAKLKIIMKAKLNSLLSGITPNDADYQLALAIVPDNLDESNRQAAIPPRGKDDLCSTKERKLIGHIRNQAWKSLLDERNTSGGRLKEKKTRPLPAEEEEDLPDYGKDSSEDEDEDGYEDGNTPEEGNTDTETDAEHGYSS